MPRSGAATIPWMLVGPAVLSTAAFVVVPLLSLVLYSFWMPMPAGAVQRTLTLANWAEYFEDTFYVSVLFDTMRVALTTTIACALIGYPPAYVLSRIGQRWTGLLLVLLFLPSWISYVVRTMSWLYILGKHGVINVVLQRFGITSEPLPLLYNEFSVHLGLVHYLLPLMIVNIYIGLQSVDRNLVAAARTLGATEWQAFLAVTLPLSLPGIGAGGLLCFMLSAGSYITPLLLGGPGTTFYSTLIVQSVIHQLNWAFGAVVSLVFIVLLAATVALYTRVAGLSNLFNKGVQ
jgi:spermidine/putrescine transport system permease protein